MNAPWIAPSILSADFARLGGTEGAEVIMWLAMRAALTAKVTRIHQNYYLPMTTAMAVAVFEEVIEDVNETGTGAARAGVQELVA